MIRLLAALAAVVLAVMATPPATAAPAVLPQRDVAVGYLVRGVQVAGRPGGPEHMEASWSAALGRLRVESPAFPQGYALVELAARRLVLVFPSTTSFLDLPLRGPTMALLADSARLRFTREGSESVLGQRCTRWRVEEPGVAARRGTVCLTEDGVLLKGDDGPGGRSLVATSLRYGSEPAARFAPPAGYHHLALPKLTPSPRQ